MGQVWKQLVPLALVLVLGGFIVGALVATAADEPDRRPPVDLGGTSVGLDPTPAGTPSSTDPTNRATPGERSGRTERTDVEVVSPRPGREGRDRDDDRDDDGVDGDDGDDDGADDD